MCIRDSIKAEVDAGTQVPLLGAGVHQPPGDKEIARQRGDGVEPVSYTHLDVYKRQLVDLVVQNFRLDAVSAAVQLRVLGPVIDVYKRQVCA